MIGVDWSMSKERPSSEECEAILKQKLKDLQEDLGDEKTNFKVSFTMTLPQSPKIEDIENDMLREKAFHDATLEGVKQAREMLIACEIPYIRPPSMFAEMIKTDEQMERIRQSLEDQRKKKERVIAKNKQKREVKEQPQTKKQVRPGISMKPKKNQKKELAKRTKEARKQKQ